MLGTRQHAGAKATDRARPCFRHLCSFGQPSALRCALHRRLPKRHDCRRHTSCQAGPAPGGNFQMRVYVPTHPLVSHWLAVCRNKLSPPPIFRSAVAELGRILIYEAAQDWLPTVDGQVETPLGLADVRFVDPSKPVKVVPILRAGLVLLEESATVLPSSETYHVGYVRNEETLEAAVYLNKLPARIAPEDRVLVSDPMIATGGTLLKVIDDLVSRGASPEFIRIISVVVAPPALESIAKKYPGLRLYTGMIDAELNDKGYIVPGLGDAGDRAFGT